jgi:hypothetical protein
MGQGGRILAGARQYDRQLTDFATFRGLSPFTGMGRQDDPAPL